MAEQETAAPPLPGHICKNLVEGKPFALPDGSPGSERYLHELPLLPHLKDEIDRRCRRPGFRSKVSRANAVHETLKFFYLTGKHAVYERTSRGQLILKVFAFEEDNEVIGDYFAGQRHRPQMGILSVPEYDEEDPSIL